MSLFDHKIDKKVLSLYILYFVLIFPFVKPQLFDEYIVTTYLYYGLKLLSTILTIVLFFTKYKVNQIHPFVIVVFLYRLIMAIPTLIYENGDIIRFLGIAIFDVGFVLLIQYGLSSNKIIFLKCLIYILDFWIILNTIALFVPGMHIIDIDYWNNKVYTSLLGIDNRFIYYYIVDLFSRIIYSYMYNGKMIKSDYIMYFLCLFTLIYTYSTAALVTWLLLIILFIILKLKIKWKILNYKFILIAFLSLNILLVFFRIQNYFETFIVDILGKDLTLSNRTFIWDKTINALNSHYILGYGYEKIEYVMANMNGANHAHNYMLMILYRGGIIGFILYSILLIIPNKYLKQEKYSKKYIVFVFFIIISLILCLFDSFDYTLFYFNLFLPCFFVEKKIN